MNFPLYLLGPQLLESKSQGGKFTILSLDGGGMRGLSTAVVLRQIENDIGKPISDLFNLVAGTSTGPLLGGLFCLPGGALTKIDQNILETKSWNYTISLAPKSSQNGILVLLR